MPRSDLRSLFHTSRPDLTAEDVFADRLDEWQAVLRSLVAHGATVRDPQFTVEDFERPRCNVLAFYGVGGIGKTSLSRRIERYLTQPSDRSREPDTSPHWPSAPDDVLGRLLPVRIDLSRQSGIDFEAVVLSVRLAVARLGRPMAAFDLALLRYWQANHPGEPLDEYLRRNGFLQKFSTAISLPDQVQSVLGDIAARLSLPGTAASVLGAGLRSIVAALREHHRGVRTLARCARLADLLEADADLETLSYFPYLLAWDLEQLKPEQRAIPVVLLDTFEEVGDRTHRDLERLIQRVVWLMPSSLFIITGRNRLQWDDERLEGQLDWVGPRAWPGLTPAATSDPRQHRVGSLSPEDCEHYLSHRLVSGGEPLIEPRTRHQIVAHSRGLPLYLDLSVMRYLDLYQRTGSRPGPDEFRYDFPALVARTFRDLPPVERDVLRTVSLLDSFSVELAAAASGQREAAVLTFVERPLVDVDSAAPWPYHLHDLIREAVHDADETAEDRWSPADWKAAAARVFAALGQEASRNPQKHDHRKRLVSCLTQGLRLARDYQLDLGWLVDAAYTYVADFVWEPLEPTDGIGINLTSPAAALAATMVAVARRQRVHRQTIADRLGVILDSGLLPARAKDLALYYRAECLRDLGDARGSAVGMREVVEGGGPLAPTAARGLIHISRRLGDFQSVRAAIDQLGPEGRPHRALGDLLWTQGSIALACAAYDSALRQAEADQAAGEAALSQACLAYASAFQDAGRADRQIQQAERLLAGATIRWAEVHTSIAKLLRDAGADPDLPQRAASVEAEAAQSGMSSSIAYLRLVVCFHHVVLQEAEAVAETRQRLRSCVNDGEFAYLVEISHFLDGSALPADLPRATWLDGSEVTAARWAAIAAERRDGIQRGLFSSRG